MRTVCATASLAVLVLLCVWLAPTVHVWGLDWRGGVCVGPCCLITDGFLEVSCGEYPHPSSP